MADEATLKGQGAVAGGGKVAVVRDDGLGGTVSLDKVDQFLADNPNFRLAGEGEYWDRVARQKYEQPGEQVRAVVEAGARGLTLGGSDLFLREAGIPTDEMRKRQEYNPGKTTAAEIGGAVAGGILIPGSPAGLAARAGTGAAKAVGGGIRGAIIGGVAEGAIVGAGVGLSDVALSDNPITTEALLHEMGSNALYGAGAGAVGGAVIHGAGAGGKKLLTTLKNEATSLSERLAAKAGPPAAERAALEGVAAPVDTAAHRAAQKEAQATATAIRKEVAVEEAAARKTAKATGKEAEAKVGEATERLKKQVSDLDRISGQNLKQAARHPSFADEVSEVRRAADEVSGLRAEVQRKLQVTREGAGRGPKAAKWGLGDEDTVAAALGARADLEGLQQAQARLQKALGNKEYGAAPLSALDDFGKIHSYVEPPSLAAKRQVLAEAEAKLHSFTSGAVKAEAAKDVIARARAAGLTDPTAEELAAFHRGMPAPAPGSQAELAAQASYFQAQATKALSQTGEGQGKGFFQSIVDRASGKLGAAAGGTAGALVAGVPGAIVGRELGGLAGDLVRGAINGKGKLAEVAVGYSKKIAEGIDRFLKATEGKGQKVSSAASRALAQVRYAPGEDRDKKPWAARMDEISQHVADPQTSRQRIHDSLAPVRNWDAFVADRMETSALIRLDYLAEKAMPKRPYEKPLGAKDRWVPTDAERSRFERIAKAAESPMSLIDDLVSGKLTPDSVMTVRDLWPETYLEIQKVILQKLPELREDLPYEKRLMLGQLFGLPVDPSLRPEMIAGIQARYANEPGTNQGTQAPMRSKSVMGSMKKFDPLTPAQRARGGGQSE